MLLTSEKSHDGHPALAHVLGSGKDEDFEGSVASIDAMVKEFAERTGLSRSSSDRYRVSCILTCRADMHVYSRLTTINGIKSLIQEQAGCPAIVDPGRTVLVQCRIIPQHCQDVCHDKHEARQRDKVGRHAHGETLDDYICVEGLEDVL